MMPVDQIPDAEPIRTAPRPRKNTDAGAAGNEPLVAVETRGDAAPPVLELPEPARRSTPRPRRQHIVANEPLVFVETRPENDTTQH